MCLLNELFIADITHQVSWSELTLREKRENKESVEKRIEQNIKEYDAYYSESIKLYVE